MGGVLYANSVITGTIWRIPVDATGKVGNPVNIWTDAPLKGPDGMRAVSGHIFVAENSMARPPCSPSMVTPPMSPWCRPG